jgi:arabinogalactan oligomer / maltooligosaccharide transport system substrate-binding protein
VAIEAFTYDGQTYGLPYAVENIALIRNADLVPEAPATFEELEEIALGLQADGTVDGAARRPAGPGDPYHNYPLFTGDGWLRVRPGRRRQLQPDDLGIDSEVASPPPRSSPSGESGLINKDVDYGVMIDSFSSGQAPFAITGPWALGEFSDINFVVEPIPPVEGGTRRCSWACRAS